MEQLFILEIVVHNINFSTIKAPLKKDILIKASCDDFVNLEIQDKALKNDQEIEGADESNKVALKCGKSWVFAITPSVLLEKMRKTNLNISVFDVNSGKLIDGVVIPWNSFFLEMVESIDEASFGYISPAYNQEVFTTARNNEINLFIRLTFVGKSINMHIQVIDVKATESTTAAGKQYLFKGNNTATTFQCRKHGASGSQEDLKNALIAEGLDEEAEGEDLANDLIELMQYFLDVSSLCSVSPSAFNDTTFNSTSMPAPINLYSKGSSTMQSLKQVVPEKNYMNLNFLLDKQSNLDMSRDESKLEGLRDVEKKLCTNKDCRGVQEFQKHGIGLLSKYQFEYVPEYYLSHANGRIDCYGPESRFRRPKRPEEPFNKRKL